MEILEAEAVKKYSLKVDAATGHIVGEDAEDGGDRVGVDVELDRVVKKYAADHNISYNAAFHRVVQDPRHQDLVRSYAES